MKISLITPTGGRGEAFSLCEEWMKKQTIQYHEWVVIDDCVRTSTKCTLGQNYIVADKQWKEGYNTQRENMNQALKEVTGDVLFLIEDDDYYAPEYLETMVKLLETSEIAGLSNSKYYHLGAGHRFMYNYEHSSLCTTAIRKSQLKRLYRAVNSGHFYFDIQMWKSCKEDGVSMALLANTKLSIGIKGMKGRTGLSRGHQVDGYTEDSELKVFKDWLGKDWEHYKPFLK